MASKKKLLKDSHLCVILDKGVLRGKKLLRTAAMAIDSGADMLQLRSKSCSVKELIYDTIALKKLAKRHNVPVIVNDRIDAALASDADGVHIGQSDIGINTAKKLLGPDKIIGLSVSSVTQAAAAIKRGADYLGVGPVFKTPLKDSGSICGIGLLKKIRRLNIPIIAIGGINIDNIQKLTDGGFRSVAVIRAVCSSRNAALATKRLKEAIA